MTLRRVLGRIYRGVTRSRYSPLRPLAEAIQFSYRMRGVRRGLRALSDTPEGTPFDTHQIERIRQAWGNPGWAADAGFLLEVSSALRTRPGPVLDCGSGVSTVIYATLAARRGDEVWTLEQDRSWYESMQRVLRALRLDNVRLWYTPLRSYGEFAWFDLGSMVLPRHFPTISCDGPALKGGTFPPELVAAWRIGAVIVLRDLGVSYEEILLDDFEDPRCAALLERWQREGLRMIVIDTPTGQFLRGSAKAT